LGVELPLSEICLTAFDCFDTSRDQHHRQDEMPPRSMGEHTSIPFDARDCIERFAALAPCSLLAKDADRSVASARSSRYPLRATSLLRVKLLQQPGKPGSGPIVHRLHRLGLTPFHSRPRRPVHISVNRG